MPGVIVINPQVFKDKRDAFAVVVDEALRLWMEDNEFSPEFDVTPEQEAFFADTPYAEGGGTSAEKGGDVGLGTPEPATEEYTPSAVPDYEAETPRRRAIGAEAAGSGPLYEGEPIAESQYLMSKKILASRTSSRTADAIVREYEKYHDPVSMGETGASGGTGPGPTHRGVPVTEGQYVLAKKIEARGRDSRLANEIIREYEEYHNIRSQNKEEGR